MPSLSSLRPSAATVIAVGALVVALSGAAVALPAHGGTITSKDIKNGEVKKPDIGKDAVTGKAVKESTLGTVPSATSATSATSAKSVNGVVIVPVRFRVLTAMNDTYFDAGGLELFANCAGGEFTFLGAHTTKKDSSMYVAVDDVEEANDPPGNDLESGSFDPGAQLAMAGGASDHNALDPAIITFEYDALDGTIITGTLATDEDVDSDGNCGITGHITVS